MARKNRTPEENARREKIRELLQMANIGSMDDIQNLFKETIAEFMENGLEAELDDELGYSKYDYKNKDTDNSRNGHSSKTLRTSFGDVEVSVPRDRKGEFEPQVLKKNQASIFQWLRSRGLDGVKLVVGDKCLGMLEAVGEVFPEAKYQRCTVHFYRNVFSVTPRSKVKLVAKMLKAIHAQESKKAAREKAKAVVEQLRSMKLKEAAKKVEDGIEETLTYCDFPSEHWTRIRTNNVIERLNREIRRRTRVVGSFPDGNSALMLVCARLRHVAGTQWGNKKYMNMKHLEAALEDASIAG